MNNKRVGLIILLLLLTVGFASVTTNLIINNTSNISSKPDDFSVVFTSANTEEESTATISEDKKSITYVTKKLVNPGDKSELEYTIKNNSSQYDADINLSVGLDSSISDLLSITYETIDNTNTINLPAKNEITGKIKIELIKPAITNMTMSLTVTFDATATERSSIAYDNYTVRFNGNGAEKGSMDDQVIDSNVSTSLLSNQFTRSGYQMIGWTTNPETNEDFYQDEQVVSKLTTSGNTVDLYAVWLKTEYDYTGAIQSLKIPITGTYKLEVWGAQGGSVSGMVNYVGAVGGYSTGTINLEQNTIIYTVVGGQGSSLSNGNVVSIPGTGYNGGGKNSSQSSPQYYGSGGGGATHIAFDSGLLSSLSSHATDGRILIVAGGGGGSSTSSNKVNNTSTNGVGGTGGGIKGTNGNTTYLGSDVRNPGDGGTQTSLGASYSNVSTYTAASFGQGCIPSGNYNSTGYMRVAGGGGYYGGGCGIHSGGGGGSGYIANPLLSNKHMSCYNCSTSNEENTKTISNTCHSLTPTVDCAKEGNGYARITFISFNN